MIYGIGTDIVEIERFQRFVDEGNTALLNRIFTGHERTFCDARKNCAASYAARFAAKEAFVKALGTGVRDGIAFHDVEIVNDELGKPEFNLTGKAHALCVTKSLGPAFLSLSHDGGNAVAMVVLESA
ncbi:MAG: holo-[acyl-carrier-protein] synthase [Desulfuromonadaceae bacterium]|nr:holo-[acyl-carrier-protein] synthase [Desulfuromonadaceae bacterium]MDD5105365.1 holo-[acyl-carrier-protein] synthase [Desulfuromonadaceae bacterium]